MFVLQFPVFFIKEFRETGKQAREMWEGDWYMTCSRPDSNPGPHKPAAYIRVVGKCATYT